MGTGAGFPSIPLKIMFPGLKVVLIEANQKKCDFLEKLGKELDLGNVEIENRDWRSFLIKAKTRKIDYFLTRASIKDDEICRMFKPSCIYNNSTMLYYGPEWYQPENACR